jgi:hypothetical protein
VWFGGAEGEERVRGCLRIGFEGGGRGVVRVL